MTDTGANLDFSKADFGSRPGGLECAACTHPVTSRYFEVNGQVMCENCRNSLEALTRTEGKAGRILRAAVFGILGGALGAAVWYGVAVLFNLEIGLIAIAVGWLVGKGVHRGSGGRGGLGYQLLAAFITYASIVTTYIPPILSALNGRTKSTAVDTADVSKGAVPAPGEPVTAAKAEAPDPPMSLMGAVGALGFGLLALYALAFAAPFFGGFENIIGILIIFIAVHQAWTLNRKLELDIQGPLDAPLPASSDSPLS